MYPYQPEGSLAFSMDNQELLSSRQGLERAMEKQKSWRRSPRYATGTFPCALTLAVCRV